MVGGRKPVATTAQSAPTGAFILRDEIETPALIVDLDIFERNLDEMAQICREAGVALTPHAKTHRTVEFGRLQLAHGASGLTVAKLGEAEAFAAAGVERLVVAYPLIGPDKVGRALALARGCDLTVATDSVEGARTFSDKFVQAGQQIKLYLIVDSGFHRVGVAPGDVASVAAEIAELPAVVLSGVMTHEGSVYEAASSDELVQRSLAAARLMLDAAAAARSKVEGPLLVSMGASASVRVVARVPGIGEVRPGIFAFNDLGQIALGTATLDSCAVRVISTVVSNPEPGRACIDAGSKTLSQDRLPEAGKKRYPGHGLLVDRPGWYIERLSEEHGWLRWRGDGPPPALQLATKLQIVPNHVCTVFSSLGESVALRQGAVIGRWRTIGPGASR